MKTTRAASWNINSRQCHGVLERDFLERDHIITSKRVCDEFLRLFDRYNARNLESRNELVYRDCTKRLSTDEEWSLYGSGAIEGNFEPALASLDVRREIEVRILVVLVLL